MVNSTAIDANALQRLREKIGGDLELLQELVDEFIEEVPQQIDNMKLSLKSADWEALRIEVHSMKSDAKSMGASQLGELCAHLELGCRDGGPDDAESEVAVIVAEAVEVTRLLKALNLNEL